MMNKSTTFILAFALFCTSVLAQVGGSAVYSFLNVPASARVAAMGGTYIGVKDNDLNCALQNPSVLNPSMSKMIAFSGVSYVDGIKFGDASYAHDFGKAGTFDFSIHYANYGTFKEADETGVITGSFHAADYAFGFGWGYQLNKLFSIGANLKGIYSDFYIYNSVGIAADLGATVCDTESGWTATILAKNVGTQFKNYVKQNNESLPIEVQAAVSKRFAHVPFRINVTARHLEKFDITYIDPNDASNVDPLTGDQKIVEPKFGTKLIRHFIIGGEILLSKNFHLRIAYNFQRRQEMIVDTRTGIVGFSFGFGLKISKFILSYGRGNYHLAGGADHFSLACHLSDFSKKKN